MLLLWFCFKCFKTRTFLRWDFLLKKSKSSNEETKGKEYLNISEPAYKINQNFTETEGKNESEPALGKNQSTHF
jgi:hypothetical protein